MEYCRTLEITSISAKNLKDVHIFSKMGVYVVVKIANDPSPGQKTPLDKLGGTSPSWTCTRSIKFTINEDAAQRNRLALHFQLKSNSTFGDDKDIGEVYVPVKDLLNDVSDHGSSEKEKIFDLENARGKAKGTVSFKYKIGERFVKENVNAKKPDPVIVPQYHRAVGRQQDRLQKVGLEGFQMVEELMGRKIKPFGSPRYTSSGSGNDFGIKPYSLAPLFIYNGVPKYTYGSRSGCGINNLRKFNSPKYSNARDNDGGFDF
ncbi:hypothetical protein L1049_019247 [Liquidambar formosana]|uniref:C2 domain-containing protein n=1 Tax=Liquidambar formosana TaxID=63359 RepID=A0AAP0SB30_LIQFO